MSSPREPASNISRTRLIEFHMPLVRMTARRFLGRGEELEDLVQVGAVGLVKAADRFEPDRGVEFRTFAKAVIEGEIRRHLRDRTGPLRIPRSLQRTGAEVRQCREQLTTALGRPPKTREIAAALSADERWVEEALSADAARRPVPVSPDEAMVLDVGSETSPAGVDDKVLLASGAHVLDERERRIVALRFQSDLTERAIAQRVGLSQAQVSRVLAGALVKLRHELRSCEQVEEPSDTAVDSAVPLVTPPTISRVGPPEETSKAARRPQSSKYRATSGYSGRFLVRMPSELHEQLVRAAERDHLSLNRYVTEALAASVADPRDREPDRPSPTESVVDAEAQPRGPGPLRVALATNLVVIVLAGLSAVALVVLALQRGV